MTNGSELVQANLIFGCAERGGSTDIVTSGQNDSGIGQYPKKYFFKYINKVTAC